MVQALARHSDLKTMQRYDAEEWLKNHADLDANDLREAINRLDGNGVETAIRDISTPS